MFISLDDALLVESFAELSVVLLLLEELFMVFVVGLHLFIFCELLRDLLLLPLFCFLLFFYLLLRSSPHRIGFQEVSTFSLGYYTIKLNELVRDHLLLIELDSL